MGEETGIEYLDSTLNIEIGCKGCELWTAQPVLQADGSKKKIRTCYAGNMVTRRSGGRGWPKAFELPELFLHRLAEAERWPDLRGKDRPDKPWLNGQPRIIFLNDLGDTFTEGLPRDWIITPLTEFGYHDERTPLQVLAGLKAITLMFTKRATEMLRLFERVECPPNIVPTTSITGPETAFRAHQVLKINSRWKCLSIEPLLKGLADEIDIGGFSWAKTGAESGPTRRTRTFGSEELQPYRDLRDMCRVRGTCFFMKQLDKVADIPPDLLVREVPAFELRDGGLFSAAGI